MVKADIGFIGLAVMGENLALNMERNGFTVAVHNKTTSVMDSFLAGRGKGKKFMRSETLQELVANVERPRTIMMMIKAGPAVDSVVNQLIPFLNKGDVIIDGGNSNWQDTARRVRELTEHGIEYVGTGVSGGEEGALNGPSIMPGGSDAAWKHIKPIFSSIAAKASDGSPCVTWIGSGGSGHFVKMVHNGIEYGDMQLISEIYWIMKEGLGLSYEEMEEVFRGWNQGRLGSYLIEITADILAYRDADGSPLAEKILDAAGQKGTGKWTGIAALEEGVPLTLIVESVFARALSAKKEDRVRASALLSTQARKPSSVFSGKSTAALIAKLEKALYSAKVASYAQGFELMKAASDQNEWKLDLASIARIWRGGCIIRSVFLDRIAQAFEGNPSLANLVIAPEFAGDLVADQSDWRDITALAIQAGLPIPALSSALSWFDGYRCASLPANLLQAQRDYFGAHTYERTDRPRGEFFHTDWTGHGGDTTSRTYNA